MTIKLLNALNPVHPQGSVDHLLNKIHHSDAFDLLKAIPNECIDMVLCDLPYGVLETHWDKLLPIHELWSELKRIIKRVGVIALTSKQPFSSLLISSNLKMYRYSWYWEKPRGANVAQVNYRPLAVIEEILIFSHAPAVYSTVDTIAFFPQMERRRKKRVNKTNLLHESVTGDRTGSPMRNPERGVGLTVYDYRHPRNLLSISDEGDRGLHPTQKPVALFEYLIRTYTQEGEIVLDMTCGSGTTGLAARKTGRQFICGDNHLPYVELARKRLQDTDPYVATELPDGSKQLSLFEGKGA